MSFGVATTDPASRTGWSIVVTGRAHLIGDLDDLLLAGITADPLEAWAPGDKEFYFSIPVTEISGRRISTPPARQGPIPPDTMSQHPERQLGPDHDSCHGVGRIHVPQPDDNGWVRLASTSDIAEESALRIDYHGVPVCVARSRGRLHAIIDRCTHQDVPLSEGEVDDGTIECFMHGSRFDLATGEALGPPAVEDVTVFPLRVDGDDIYVVVPPHLTD